MFQFNLKCFVFNFDFIKKNSMIYKIWVGLFGSL